MAQDQCCYRDGLSAESSATRAGELHLVRVYYFIGGVTTSTFGSHSDTRRARLLLCIALALPDRTTDSPFQQLHALDFASDPYLINLLGKYLKFRHFRRLIVKGVENAIRL